MRTVLFRQLLTECSAWPGGRHNWHRHRLCRRSHDSDPGLFGNTRPGPWPLSGSMASERNRPGPSVFLWPCLVDVSCRPNSTACGPTTRSPWRLPSWCSRPSPR